VKVTKQNREDVMVRRIKEDLREIQGGFPKRIVDQITLRDRPSIRQNSDEVVADDRCSQCNPQCDAGADMTLFAQF
jgi:hypothetical protein